MGYRELGHVIILLPQRDEIIIDPRLILPGIIEIKTLRLNIVKGKLLALEFGNLFQESLLVCQ
jgi:hypothetical protein